MKIIKSFRKTISMKVDEAWTLIVNAPLFVNKKKIDEFIEKNKEWIDKRKTEALSTIKKFTESEEYYFFWNTYKLIFDDKSENITFDGLNFYLNKKHKYIVKDKLLSFYKKEAKKYIHKRLSEIVSELWLEYNNLRITSAKTRWWSCTSKKNINFSFRLIMSPIKTIDYVITHELAHLKEMNHSKSFRDLNDNYFRKINHMDYKPHKKWLKDYGNKLMYL